MPDLAGSTEGAGDELPVGDDARTDAGADGDHHEVGDAVRGTAPHLPHRCGVGVVHAGDDGVGHGILERVDKAVGVELDVCGHGHAAVCGNGSGDVDTAGDDLVHLRVIAGEQARETARHHLEAHLFNKRGCGNLALPQNLAFG